MYQCTFFIIWPLGVMIVISSVPTGTVTFITLMSVMLGGMVKLDTDWLSLSTPVTFIESSHSQTVKTEELVYFNM